MEDTTFANFTAVNAFTKSYEILNRMEIQENILCIAFLGMLIPLGITGNVSILVIFSRHYKPTVFRIFVFCLAAVDLCISVFGIPYAIFEIVFRFAHTASFEQSCKIAYTFEYSLVVSSTSLLFGLSTDRFRNVMFPLKPQMTTGTAKVICVFTFCVAVIVCLPAYFYARVRDASCDVTVHTQGQNAYTKIVTVLFLLMTLSVIIVYICIGVKLYRQYIYSKKVLATGLAEPMKSDSRIDTKMRKENKVNRIAIMICTIFVCSFAPYLTIANTIGIDRGGVGYCIVQRFFYINSVANPFIYGFIDKKFRGIFREYIGKCIGLICRKRLGNNTVGKKAGHM